MEDKKETRGGGNRGAGRKRIVAKVITFGATQESQSILENLKDVKKAVYINAAIVAYNNNN